MLERNPTAATELGDRVPYPFPTDPDADLQQWLAELQAEADELDEGLDAVLESLQVPNADDGALDELGKDHGRLGQRRGRSDSQYRAFLLSLVAAFDGRGTAPGIRTAIAAGVLADKSAIALVEDTDALEYEVVLSAWDAHQTGTIHELADLADPSVVQRRDPLHYRLAAAVTEYTVGDTAIPPMTTLADAVTRYTASDTDSRTVDSAGTFGTGSFDGTESFS